MFRKLAAALSSPVIILWGDGDHNIMVALSPNIHFREKGAVLALITCVHWSVLCFSPVVASRSPLK
jgi:hypothetical protein